MRTISCVVLMLFLSVAVLAQKNSYVFVWGGDDAKKDKDFLAVINSRSTRFSFRPAVFSTSSLERTPRIGMTEDAFSGSFDAPSVPFGKTQGPSSLLQMT